MVHWFSRICHFRHTQQSVSMHRCATHVFTCENLDVKAEREILPCSAAKFCSSVRCDILWEEEAVFTLTSSSVFETVLPANSFQTADSMLHRNCILHSSNCVTAQLKVCYILRTSYTVRTVLLQSWKCVISREHPIQFELCYCRVESVLYLENILHSSNCVTAELKVCYIPRTSYIVPTVLPANSGPYGRKCHIIKYPTSI
jgi:hypothetical protein